MRATLTVLFCLSFTCAALAVPAGSAFTYQGRLTYGGVALDGPAAADLRFTLYDAATAGNVVAGPLPVNAVNFSAGLFTADLDFGPAAFNGQARWLAIEVATPSGSTAFTALSPRQALNAAPYALRALSVPNGSALDAPGGTPANVVQVAGNGNVGIGMSGAAFKLDVLSTGNGASRFRTSDPFGAVVAFESTAGGRNWSLISSGSAHPAGAGKLIFRDVSGGADRLTLAPDGNVGIGTTNPSDLLHLAAANPSLRIQDAGGSGKTYHLSINSGNGSFSIAESGVADRITISGDGNVGINSASIANPHQLSSVLNVTGRSTGSYAGSTGVVLRNQIVGSEWSMFVDTSGSMNFAHAGPGPSTVSVPVLRITGGADIAEPFDVSGQDTIQPGMVVSIDPQRVGELCLASRAYDTTVAGVISGAGGVNPGLMLTQQDTVASGKHPVALTGRVWCYCDASAAPIQSGDLLTTSDTPGHAMKVLDRHRAGGAILGKAMSSLKCGQGLVLVLVSLQ